MTSRQTELPVFSVSEGKNGSLWLSGIDFLKRVSPRGEVRSFRIEMPFSYIFPSPGDGRVFIIGLRDGLMEVTDEGEIIPFGPGFQNVSAILMARDGTF